MTIHLDISGEIALLTISRPPVNSLDRATRVDLAARLKAAFAEPQIQAIVLWGGTRVFSAGADIEEFAAGLEGPTYARPTLPEIVSLLDAAPKPVVAAIHGVCLGGGLEVALACQARVCGEDAKFGLPEVKLGILPGAGGTQRLARLIGIDPALQLILSGATIDAVRAQELGVARIAEGDLIVAAQREARSLVGTQWTPASALTAQLPQGEQADKYFKTQRANLRRPLPAPLACIEAVESTTTRSFAEGVEHEGQLFRALLQTPESKALRYAFFGDRVVGKLRTGAAAGSDRTAHHVAIIGAGTMGTGIAICCLDAGLPTTLIDAVPSAAAGARNRIAAHYQQAAERGRVTEAIAHERLHRLTTAEDYNAIANCDLAIEAVYEDMSVKHSVFAQMDQCLRPGAILASNTSTLDLNSIASATSRPQDVVGLHFFTPAHVMKLLEVVRGRQTSDSTLAAALKFGKAIGKIPVVAGVCDGFIGNRMFEEYLRQAYFLTDVGVLPWQVDAALERWGMVMGPFAVMDLAGGDIGLAIRSRRRTQQPNRPYSTLPDRVCEMNRLGRKSGAGFYAYDANGRRSPDPVIARLVTEHASAIGRQRPEIADEEIIDRCIFALINEGARLLDEGIAERASDIDVVYRHGYGFPAHLGGPLFLADSIGLDRVLASMAKFRAGYEGWFWDPAPRLVDAAKRGIRLSDT